MSTSTKNLHPVYVHQTVRKFGECLRKALEDEKDYASLIALEYAETKEDFFDALKDFLRRYDGYVKKRKREKASESAGTPSEGQRKYEWWKPPQSILEELAQVVDDYGVRVVRTALISHALVYWDKTDSEKEETDE